MNIMKLKQWWNNFCWHSWHMPAYHVVTIENETKKLWVVLICQKCKTIKRIGRLTSAKPLKVTNRRRCMTINCYDCTQDTEMSEENTDYLKVSVYHLARLTDENKTLRWQIYVLLGIILLMACGLAYLSHITHS